MVVGIVVGLGKCDIRCRMVRKSAKGSPVDASSTVERISGTNIL